MTPLSTFGLLNAEMLKCPMRCGRGCGRGWFAASESWCFNIVNILPALLKHVSHNSFGKPMSVGFGFPSWSCPFHTTRLLQSQFVRDNSQQAHTLWPSTLLLPGAWGMVVGVRGDALPRWVQDRQAVVAFRLLFQAALACLNPKSKIQE